MTFYVWDEQVDEEELWVTDYDAVDFVDYKSREGLPLTSTEPVATLVVADDEKRAPHILVGINGFPVVSETFRRAVVEFGDVQVQFLPVEVHYCDEPINSEPYWYLNVLHNVACLDLEKSELEISELTGIPTEVYSLVLLEDKIADRHLVRMDEFHTILLISAPLRKALEDAGVASRHFMNVEDYTDDEW